MATALTAALFNARKARRRRYKRAGAPRTDPSRVIEAPGAALPSPLAGGEELLAVSLVFEIEFFDGTDYPAGTLLDTTEFQIALTAPGVLTLDGPVVPTVGISVDIADTSIPGGGRPPAGLHTIVAYIDPPGDRAGLFLDGDQIGQDTGAFASWSSGTWDYLDSVTDLGLTSVLEVFIDFTPPAFVG